jgi:hypothetical protein
MWLKIKIWTKALIFGALVVYTLVFLLKNSDENANIWYWFFKPKYEVSVLLLTFFAFVAGVIGTLLVRTTFTTIRQIREARARSRTDRLEREVADMKSKAAMLKTKSYAQPAPAPSAPRDPGPGQPLDESA